MFSPEPYNTIDVAVDWPAGVDPLAPTQAHVPETDLHALADDGCPHHDQHEPA